MNKLHDNIKEWSTDFLISVMEDYISDAYPYHGGNNLHFEYLPEIFWNEIKRRLKND